MLDYNNIKKIVEEEIKDKNIFLVNLFLRNNNNILVYVDTPQGITIDECAMLSRTLENRLDRKNKDFSLEVSSPGLDKTFVYAFQYKRNIGQQMNILTKNNDKYIGKIVKANDSSITLKTKSKEKIEKTKKTKIVEQEHEIKISDIKSSKVIVSI